MAIKASFDVDKFKRDLKRQVKKYGEEAIDKMVQRDLKKIGDQTVGEMKDQISKGLSPIEGWGRFPAYKWVGKANAIKRIARNLSKDRRARARLKAKEAISGKYPYSVMGKYPDKKVRPVNLYLSGRFLSKLRAYVVGAQLLIGFGGAKDTKIEHGHRTGGIKGVNDQPQRPIIPIGNETFTRSILSRLLNKVRLAIEKEIKVVVKSDQ